MQEVLLKLENWNCDVKGAMERFLDDEELYISFLPTVADDPAFELLGKALSEGDAKNAFEQSHLLKGVLANMGVTPLLNIVVDIVEPTRKGETEGLIPVYNSLMRELAYFKNLIE